VVSNARRGSGFVLWERGIEVGDTVIDFLCEVFENSIEGFVGVYHVTIIKMIISSSISVNIKLFYCV